MTDDAAAWRCVSADGFVVLLSAEDRARLGTEEGRLAVLEKMIDRWPDRGLTLVGPGEYQ